MALRMRAFAVAAVVSAVVPMSALAQTTPPRGPNEGKGPFKRLVIRGVDADRRHRRSAARPDGHRHRGQPHREVRQRRPPGLPLHPNREPRRRRPRDRREGHVRDARLRRHARATPAARRRTPDASTPTSCGWRTASRPSAACRWPATPSTVSEKAREREERDRRAAHLQLPAPGPGWDRRRGRHAGEGARVGALGRGQRHRRHQVRRRATRRRRSWRRCSTRRRSSSMGTTAHLSQSGVAQMNALKAGAPRPRHRHALLRPHRVAAQGPTIQPYPGRLQLQQRAGALRRQVAQALEPDLRAAARSEWMGLPEASRRPTASRSIRR